MAYSTIRLSSRAGQDHHLSAHAPLSHVPQSLHPALERVTRAHVRLHAPGAQPLHELGAVRLEERRLAPPELAPEYSDHGTALEQHEVEGNARDLVLREADDQVAALPRDRPQGGLAVVAADRIEHDIDAAGCQRLEPLAQVLVRIVDEGVGAARAAERKLLGARRSGDHARAHELAELHRGEADTA